MSSRLYIDQPVIRHSNAIVCRTATHRFVRRLYETDELNDLTTHPYERHDLIHGLARSGVVAS